MEKLDIAGLKVDSLSKPELLEEILRRVKNNQKTWVTTVYSEFLYEGLRNPKVMEMLNKADIAVPDGIGILWAERFLSIPLTLKNYWLKILQAYWQVKYSLLAILFRPQWITAGAEKIPGSELIWDIVELAAKNNLSVYLLGGFGNTPKIVSEKLSQVMKNAIPPFRDGRHEMGVIGYSNKNADDVSALNEINKTKPDILLVAYGPIKQEKWINENLNKLESVKLAMGVGGTFDYLAGKRLAPPGIIRKIGLEWLFRLFTQPYRLKRIWNATLGLINLLIHYKVFQSFPLRKNVASIIINSRKEVLIFQRSKFDQRWETKQPHEYENYWQFTQGGIDPGEDLLKGAQREIKEETGITSLEFLAASKHTNVYNFRNAIRPFFKNRIYQFRGQSQNIVYFKFLALENEIRLDKNELINYKRIALKELENIIHPERLALTKIVQEDLKEMSQKGII